MAESPRSEPPSTGCGAVVQARDGDGFGRRGCATVLALLAAPFVILFLFDCFPGCVEALPYAGHRAGGIVPSRPCPVDLCSQVLEESKRRMAETMHGLLGSVQIAR